MRIQIMNIRTKNVVQISDDSPIPRVGERVVGEYTPTPSVREVVYDYQKSIVVVFVE